MRPVLRIGALLVLASTLGCGAAPPPTADPQVKSTAPAVASAPAPAAPAEPLATASAVPEVAPAPALDPAPVPFDAPALPPAFFDLRADLEKLFPEKAKLIAGDAATLAPQPSEGASERRAMLWPTPVIEARDPDYRLACSTSSLRIALYVPADALAAVARKLTVLTPTAAVKVPKGPLESGVFLAPGARVSVLKEGSDTRVLVRYNGLFLTANAFAETGAIGKTYTPGALPPDPILNGELTANVSILDAPGGISFALVAKDAGISNRLLVHTLGPAKDGYRRVRYEEGDAAVFGWVEEASVKDIPPINGGGWGGSGFGGGRPKDALKLPAGTRLRAPTAAPDSAVGVLTKEDELECTGGCEGDAPTVRVYGCGSNVEVVALRPGRAAR